MQWANETLVYSDPVFKENDIETTARHLSFLPQVGMLRVLVSVTLGAFLLLFVFFLFPIVIPSSNRATGTIVSLSPGSVTHMHIFIDQYQVPSMGRSTHGSVKEVGTREDMHTLKAVV